MREVAVCAVAAVIDNQIAANTQTPRSALFEKRFITIPLSAIGHPGSQKREWAERATFV